MKPAHERGVFSTARFANIVSVCVTASILIAAQAFSGTAHAGDIPIFAADASWPKPLPNNWIIGQVGGITVDWQGHIWVIQRPRSLTENPFAFAHARTCALCLRCAAVLRFVRTSRADALRACDA